MLEYSLPIKREKKSYRSLALYSRLYSRFSLSGIVTVLIVYIVLVCIQMSMVSNLVTWIMAMRFEEMFPAESRAVNGDCDPMVKHKIETFGGLNMVLFGDMLQLK